MSMTRPTGALVVCCLVAMGYGALSSAQGTHAARSGAASIDLEDFLEMPMTGRVDGKEIGRAHV